MLIAASKTDAAVKLGGQASGAGESAHICHLELNGLWQK
jgi:hypothetical protein